MCRSDVGSLLRGALPKRARSENLGLLVLVVLFLCIFVRIVLSLGGDTPSSPSIHTIFVLVAGLVFWIVIIISEKLTVHEELDSLFELIHR